MLKQNHIIILISLSLVPMALMPTSDSANTGKPKVTLQDIRRLHGAPAVPQQTLNSDIRSSSNDENDEKKEHKEFEALSVPRPQATLELPAQAHREPGPIAKSFFLYAIMCGSPALVNACLDEGIDPNIRINDAPVLLYAIERRCREGQSNIENATANRIIRTLLRRGANPNVEAWFMKTAGYQIPFLDAFHFMQNSAPYDCYTPLSLAATYGELPVVKLLLKADASVDGLRSAEYPQARSHTPLFQAKKGAAIAEERAERIPYQDRPRGLLQTIASRYFRTMHTLINAGGGSAFEKDQGDPHRIIDRSLIDAMKLEAKSRGLTMDNLNNLRLNARALLPALEQDRANCIQGSLNTFLPHEVTQLCLRYADVMDPYNVHVVNLITQVQGYLGNIHIVLNKAAAQRGLNNGQQPNQFIIPANFKFASPIIRKFLADE